MQYRYKVAKRYARGNELACAAFMELNDANAFIEKKAKEDALLKTNVIYCLYEGLDLIQEIDSSKINFTQAQETSASGQGRTTGSSFTPTPFNTTPKPPGSPQSWGRDEDKEKK